MINIDIKLLSFDYDWRLVYEPLPATWAVSWDVSNVNEESKALTGLDSQKPKSLEQSVKTGKETMIVPLQIGTACIMLVLLVSWFVYRKFQEGDTYHSYISL